MECNTRSHPVVRFFSHQRKSLLLSGVCLTLTAVIAPSLLLPVIGLLSLLTLLQGLRHYRLLNRQLCASREVIDSHVMLLELDPAGRIQSLSRALSKHSGHSHDHLMRHTAAALWPREQLSFYQQQLRQVIISGESWHGEAEQVKATGDRYLAAITISPRFDQQGKLVGISEFRHDITSARHIQRLSVTDELTGLGNRRHFNQVLSSELVRARQRPLCLAVLDVDCFKGYNDSYGHIAGDEALQQVARLLSHHLQRSTDFCFRLGGEEFALLFCPRHAEGAARYLDKVRSAIQQLSILHSSNSAARVLTVSIGFALAESGSSISDRRLYQQADNSLYQAKNSGRNRVCGPTAAVTDFPPAEHVS